MTLLQTPSQFDIIAITETSHKNDEFFTTNVSIEGYKEFYTASHCSKGGVALFVNENYDIFERSDLKTQNDCFESVWVEIKNTRNKNILRGCIYRHPKHDRSEFMIYLETSLKNVSSENKEVNICGDFNVDLLKINEINNYQLYYNLICSFGFLPLIIQPTRVVDNQTPSLIDHIFTNNLSDEIISGNIYLTLPEHFCQFASVKSENIEIKKIKMYSRNYSKFSSKDFHDGVAIQNWNYELDNPTDLFNDFFWRLECCVERHAPITKLNYREIKLKVKPWITPKLSKMIKIKNKMFERKKRQPLNDYVKFLYNIFRNRVNRELKKSKKSYYDSYFEEHSNNIKKTWEGIRSIINIKNSVNPTISQLTINGRVIDETKMVVNEFNNFFRECRTKY